MCPGMLVTCRQDAPPVVHFQCPACGSSGVITGWEDSRWDCSHLREPASGSVPVAIPAAAHAELRRALGDDPVWRQVLYTSSTDGAADAVILIPEEVREELHERLALATFRASSRRQVGHLLEVVGTLAQGSSGSEAFFLAGKVSGSSLAEALSGFEVERAPRDRPRRSAEARTFQIKAKLRYASPPIWRRLIVPAAITLAELHEVLQVAMGWLDGHLHAFRAGDREFSIPHPELEPLGEDSRKVRLCDVAPLAKSRIDYEYDFGDGWSHEVIVEKVIFEPCHEISCVAGRRACPPEDCGGVGGYERLLHVLADPGHEEHTELLEWVGGSYDAERFDRDEVNALLATTRACKRHGQG